MGDSIDMSLDDIIKKTKGDRKGTRGGRGGRGGGSRGSRRGSGGRGGRPGGRGGRPMNRGGRRDGGRKFFRTLENIRRFTSETFG